MGEGETDAVLVVRGIVFWGKNIYTGIVCLCFVYLRFHLLCVLSGIFLGCFCIDYLQTSWINIPTYI